MILKTWSLLFVLFAAYSGMVYVYSSGVHRGQPPSKEVQWGWNLWQNKNCHTCHQLYGLGGYMGPDLTNMISDPTKGPAYMRVFIKYGTSKMPDLHLSDHDVDALLKFLSWVDKSGKTRVDAKNVHWTGTYILK
ncbi:c-type cytochrome [Arcticibacter tournemirensis]|uniref:Cytochrome c n=1 Tax=Arcticibacter tournemirensis TaxID=699437 RepID=A0A4Q0MD64_9SPHI|nr:cytochrome c [Arcticibacter tournemirensis]RXF71164.1 cytochrome c [Arcticibacter tournemirensis]